MQVSAIIDDSAARELTMRGTVTEALRATLARYYGLLRAARAELRRDEHFAPAELALLCDVCSGTLWEPLIPEMLQANMEDCEPAYYAKWGVARTGFLTRLHSLDVIACVAVIDAIERVWRASGTGLRVDPAHLLDEPEGSG